MTVRRAPQELVSDLLQEIRKRFYDSRPNGEKEFYQERSILVQAILFPARFLAPRGTRLSWERYRAVIVLICDTIAQKGKVASIRTIGRYVLHAVQEHMRHHWNDYHEEGKRLGDDLTAAMIAIRQLTGNQPKAKPSVISDLDQIAATILPKGGRKKAPATRKDVSQQELF